MGIREIQEEIIRLKKEKDICILAHCYQTPEILEVADFVGDSFALSVSASKVKNKTVIMCGVRFMAETVKILSPEKKVILSNADAGCPMAEMMDRELIAQVKEQYPDYKSCQRLLHISTQHRSLKQFAMFALHHRQHLKFAKRLIPIKSSLFRTEISALGLPNSCRKKSSNCFRVVVPLTQEWALPMLKQQKRHTLTHFFLFTLSVYRRLSRRLIMSAQQQVL